MSKASVRKDYPPRTTLSPKGTLTGVGVWIPSPRMGRGSKNAIPKLKLIIVVLVLACTALAQAGVATYQFENPEDRARFDRLSQELRCLVCQNQNLADSNADLATDLRREIYNMIQKGLSDQEIVEFMVARYGDFVLYRPPVKSTTYLLWFGPFVLFAAGILIMLRLIRQRTRNESRALSEAERARLQLALAEDERGSEP